MRLRKLLLGSAAAMFVVGASTGAAKAADPMNGLVVTMAEYLESCSSGNGIQFSVWCFKFSGSSVFSTEIGYEIDYGTGPVGNTIVPVGGTFPWSGFSLTNKLALTATREFGDDKTITVKIPIVGSGTTSLSISKAGGATWTFTASDITVEVPTNFADFTFVVAEGGAHPFLPDLDATADFDFSNFSVSISGGVGFDDEDVNGFASPLFFNPSADLEVGYDGDTFGFDFGAHWARVYNAGVRNAYGIDGEVSASFGMFSMNLGGSYGINDDFSGNYNYSDILVGDRLFSVWGGAEVEWNDAHTTSLDVVWAGSLLWDQDTTVEVDLEHEWTVGDGFSVTGSVGYMRAYDGFGTPLNAFRAGVELSVDIQ